MKFALYDIVNLLAVVLVVIIVAIGFSMLLPTQAQKYTPTRPPKKAVYGAYEIPSWAIVMALREEKRN